MPPGVRKVALTAHVAFSVGWLGAVGAFLALAIAGLSSGDAELTRAAYLAMELTGWYVLVPLSVASLITGLVQALGTSWGSFRHYWVLLKLLITVLATAVLLVHMRPVSHLADLAAESGLTGAHTATQIQVLADAGAAGVVLLVAIGLSVFKPRGLTRHGWRRSSSAAPGAPRTPALRPTRHKSRHGLAKLRRS
ncbi:DUF2269 domain-containing protein [Saccharopolyspora terrae]|uniref:DUF2269 domain-containing protein n=1 Tax=Saccharopolyspora terrae TaxID=2530384 RepID=UPI001A9E0A52|nr:DUF2269 domain-containing protein [Saccharopolyspora terrae]